MTIAVASLDVAREGLHISASAVSTLQECPRRFWYRYIEAVPEEDIAASLVLGKAIHKALALFYRCLQVGEPEPDARALLTIAGASIVSAASSPTRILFKDGEDAGSLVERARDLILAFIRDGYRPAKVLAVELPFSMPVVHPRTGAHLAFDERIVGAIDLIAEDEDSTMVVVDHKSAAKSDSQVGGRADLQMALYALVTRTRFSTDLVRLKYQRLVRTKVPKVEHVDVERRPMDGHEAIEAVASALKLIQVAVAHPQGKLLMGRRRSWKCRDCPYRRRCEAERW